MKTPKRRSPPARELGDPKYRARTERDRTKYHRVSWEETTDFSWEAVTKRKSHE